MRQVLGSRIKNICRPPHGGRGLKYVVKSVRAVVDESPPARGAWIEIMMEGYSIYRMLSDRANDLKAKADAK